MMDRTEEKQNLLDMWKDGMREVLEWQAQAQDRRLS